MSVLDFFNKGVNPNADSTGVKAHPPSGGKHRSYFLEPYVKASSLSNTLSGNLHLKGRSKSTDENGKSYPWGFTPDVDFYIDPTNINYETSSPVERGNVLQAGIRVDDGVPKFGIPRDTNDILNNDIPNAFDAFNEDGGYEFQHHLDRGDIPSAIKLTKDSDIYLSSYVETDTDNEDPISFGYDLIIDVENSPLFNGAVEDFISQFSSYTEVSSRAKNIKEFKKQFFKFFKVNISNTLEVKPPRTYYLRKISGLDGLSESISSDKSKQFVEYGKDFINLTLYEDVSVNTGYLAALYKILTWSRINGKKIIPDNLLRFDVEIVVTERRRFNRVIKNGDNTMDQFSDLMSRYRYKLYECQFFFEKFSHGNDIDLRDTNLTQDYDIKFNYKFSTMRFEKFTDQNSVSGTRKHIDLDNINKDLNKIDPKYSNSFSVNNSNISLNPIDYVLKKYTPIQQSTTYIPILLPANAVQMIVPLSSLNKTPANTYQDKLNNMKINSIKHRSNLLQRTLENIETTFKSDINMFIYDLKQDVLNFIPGNFVGGFTEDGYEYNIPAYYINKAFNTANNTLRKSIGTIGASIYEQKNIAVQGFLNNINEGIDYGNNLLNNELGKLTGHYSGGGTKPSNIYNSEDTNYQVNNNPLNIYGNSSPTRIVYDGSYISSDNAPDTPAHDTGAPLDIYAYEPVYPDTPSHDVGAPLDIYAYEPVYPDTPSHDVGAPLDIYSYEPVYPDTPGHDTGSPLSIYSFEPTYPDTPLHNTGEPLDIYNREVIYEDTPIHTTGDILDIYKYEPVYEDTPSHNTGSPLSIYDTTVDSISEVPTKKTSIYDTRNDVQTPSEKKDTLSIYDSKKETKDIKGGGNSLNIYGK